MDFNSLTPDQKQAVICASAIQQYARSILNSAGVSHPCSESSALVKLYSCFLIVDDTAFNRSEDIRYQCLAQLAGNFNDYDKYSSEIMNTVNRYIASWNARRIRFADDPSAKATLADMPSLLGLVAEDLQSDGYSVDPLFISRCVMQYRKDFLADKPADTLPADAAAPSDAYLSALNKVFDELASAIPNPAMWKAFRNLAIENYNKYFEQHFPDSSKRPSPQQYAVEYALICCINAFDKEPFVDTSHNLTEIGDLTRDFALQLGDYGVKKKYISDSSWKSLSSQLLEKSGSVRSTQSSEKNPPSDKMPASSVLLLIVLAIAFIIIFAFGGNEKSPVPSASSKSVASSISLVPVTQPQTGLIYDASYDEALAPFTVNADSDTNYYIRLCDGKEIILGYYIRAGETLSVEVPLGQYSLYYACAPNYSSWFGESDLWGTHTSYYKSSDLWEFDFDGEYYNGYTLNLSKPTSAGNTKVTPSYSNVWDSLY